MDSGIYLNLFKVDFDDSPVLLMTAQRNSLPKLNDVRIALSERGIAAHVYSVEDRVYGYGTQQELLSEFNFSSESVQIGSKPQLASRLILEGFVSELAQAGYSVEWSKQGARVFQLNPPLWKHSSGLTLYRGFDMQSLYLNDPEVEGLLFAVVIDAIFTYRDMSGQSLRPDVVKARFGDQALNDLLTKQGDMTPQGKINLEVSYQRLHKQILPFVAQRGKFTLPCGTQAELMHDPIRVVLAADEEEL